MEDSGRGRRIPFWRGRKNFLGYSGKRFFLRSTIDGARMNEEHFFYRQYRMCVLASIHPARE